MPLVSLCCCFLVLAHCLAASVSLPLLLHVIHSMLFSWVQHLALPSCSVPGYRCSCLCQQSSGLSKLHSSLVLTLGAALVHISSSSILRIAGCKTASANDLPKLNGFPVSVQILQSFLSCGVVALHGLAEGLALGVAAPKAYGLGQHTVLPVSLHGLPRGAMVASCILGATYSWQSALAAVALIDYRGNTRRN